MKSVAFYKANITAVRQHRLCANITNPLADLHINLAFYKNERLLYRVALLVEKRQRFEIDYIVALSGVAFG